MIPAAFGGGHNNRNNQWLAANGMDSKVTVFYYDNSGSNRLQKVASIRHQKYVKNIVWSHTTNTTTSILALAFADGTVSLQNVILILLVMMMSQRYSKIFI